MNVLIIDTKGIAHIVENVSECGFNTKTNSWYWLRENDPLYSYVDKNQVLYFGMPLKKD